MPQRGIKEASIYRPTDCLCVSVVTVGGANLVHHDSLCDQGRVALGKASNELVAIGRLGSRTTSARMAWALF
jgi:hypothetical protein